MTKKLRSLIDATRDAKTEADKRTVVTTVCYFRYGCGGGLGTVGIGCVGAASARRGAPVLPVA